MSYIKKYYTWLSRNNPKNDLIELIIRLILLISVFETTYFILDSSNNFFIVLLFLIIVVNITIPIEYILRIILGKILGKWNITISKRTNNLIAGLILGTVVFLTTFYGIN
jgi:hypothetical protein